jgi:hypothetical protein
VEEEKQTTSARSELMSWTAAKITHKYLQIFISHRFYPTTQLFVENDRKM